jgi:nucleotide-binding universal stress UspA family protein
MTFYKDLPDNRTYSSALQDFRRARSQAFLKELVSRFTGESTELLSFEEVRQKLRAFASSDRGLQDIPLNAIVGSVGRYNDFTRDFLPRQDTSQERWARVKAVADGLTGLPPIEVYKIGDAYFVKDGNHRVSVARQMGVKDIQAFVIEVRTRVPLSPEVKPDELIVKAEYAEFLERTHLDELRPGADLSVTIPGQYATLEEHIAVHRHYMGNEQKRFISEDEAVQDWYDSVYLPVDELIREIGILRHFPGRTDTDLYCWIAEYRASLEKEWGTEIPTAVAAWDLSQQEGGTTDSVFNRIGGKLLDFVSLGVIESEPPTGQWRQEVHTLRQDDCLFSEILVPVNGEASGWFALDQACIIARRESSRLLGLHILPEDEGESEVALGVQAEFIHRCQEQGIPGSLKITSGEVARIISNEARLTDLVVTTLLYPPPPQLLARLDSGFHELIQRCPRPVLAVPQVVSPIEHALLSYDGSPKADEALYVATYMAARWHVPLTVITVFEDNRIAPETLLRAQSYLEEHEVEANLVKEEGDVAQAILRTAETRQADLIVMGGYGAKSVLNMILGSKVDQVLREARKPVLICR